MRCGALMRGFGMCGGMSVLHVWRPRGALAEAGPLSNTPREERADPTLTLPCEARKHVISRTDYGFIDSQCVIILRIWKLEPSGGGVDGSRRLGGREDGDGEIG